MVMRETANRKMVLHCTASLVLLLALLAKGQAVAFNDTCDPDTDECDNFRAACFDMYNLAPICQCPPGLDQNTEPTTSEVYCGDDPPGNATTSQVGEYCNKNSECSTNNTECTDEGSNTGQFRCACRRGYVQIDNLVADPHYSYCGLLRYEGIEGNCSACEGNGGTCYIDDADLLSCLCPSTKSGADCETFNVEVVCDVVKFEMVVCYTPHSTLDTPTVNTNGFVQDPACLGYEVATDQTCPNNTYKIVLPLDDDRRERCGVESISQSIHVRRYEALVVAHDDEQQLSIEDVLFKTYCSFETYAERTFQALGVLSIGKGDRGQHKSPSLTMSVETLLGTSIPPGVALRLGDKIKLRLTLEQDGTYSALRVLRCTASTKATIPDASAITVPLIVNSCPYWRQRIITIANTFQQTKPGVLLAQPVQMFKMAQGNTVHLHCTVKLCLSGSEGECAPVSCGGDRKKRAARSADQHQRVVEVQVHRELKILDVKEDEYVEQGTTSNMVWIIGAVGLLMLTLVLLAVLLYRRVTKHLSVAGLVPFDTLNSSVGSKMDLITEKTGDVQSVSGDSGVVFSRSGSANTDVLKSI